jgi:acyl-CoA synthetase (AMP-forming)/AMP-acid ligase II
LTILDEVADAAAFVAPMEDVFDKVWVAVEPNGQIDATHLISLCRKRLARFDVDFLIVVKTLPRNAMGKVSKATLHQLATATKQQAIPLKSYRS